MEVKVSCIFLKLVLNVVFVVLKLYILGKLLDNPLCIFRLSTRMRVTAKITAEEERYDTFKCVSTSKIITGYEMESVERTINIQQNARNSVQHCGRKLGSAIARFLSSQMSNEQRPDSRGEEKESEFAKKLDLALRIRRKEKEELWKKVMSQTTRQLPKEESYILIEEMSLNESSPLDSQQLRKERVLIRRNDYYYIIRQGVLRTYNDLAMKSGNYMVPFLLNYCQKIINCK